MSAALPSPADDRSVLVTGGAGFVGANLAERLAAEGRTVIVYDALARPGVERNLAWLSERHGGRIVPVNRLRGRGVWANDPVPLYPYPSSPDYRRLWGEPDDGAWERAHTHYLAQFERFSDIQDERPLPLAELEAGCGCR